ncbi:MAG: hypothetical protein ACOX44_11665 [Limnochordia bacterium]
MIWRRHGAWCGILVAGVIALLLNWGASAAPVEQIRQSIAYQDDQVLRQYALTDVVPAGEPFTLITQVQLDLPGQSDSLFGSGNAVPEQVVLAGVSTTAGEEPTALALVWQLDASGWFPTWKLYLISNAGLLNSAEQRLKLDAEEMPFDGDEFRTLFSFDPSTGTLSIQVIKVADNKVVYAGNTQVQPVADALYPGVGAQSTESAAPTQIAVHELRVEKGFIPVGAQVRIMARIAGTDFVAAMSALDRRDEWLLDAALPQRELEHPLQVTFDDGRKQTLFADLQGLVGNRRIDVDSHSAPAGKLDMVLRYMVDGNPWEISRVPIRIGTASTIVRDVRLDTDDQGQLAVLGTVAVTSDGPLPAFHVLLDYELHAPGALTPLYSRWKKQVGQTSIYVE